MLDKLPIELLDSICSFLDINSIYNLKYSNTYLYDGINKLSSLIISRELKKCNINLTKEYVYTFILHFCKNIIYQNKNNIIVTKQIKNLLINYDILDNEIYNQNTNFLNKTTINSLYEISYNPHVNKLFKDLLNYYIFNGNLHGYDKIKLFYFYHFLKLEQFDVANLNYYIEFIEDLTLNRYINKYDDIIINYYTFE